VSGDDLDVATNAYTMLDLSASWLFTVKGSQVHSVTMRVDSALDEQYRDPTSRIKSYAFNPGRNVSVVYKLLFQRTAYCKLLRKQDGGYQEAGCR